MTDPMIARARVAAPIATVHQALTDAASLRVWLAEFAEVDLAGGRYEFWGRFTPEGDSPHQHLSHVDDTSLGFTWLLDGEDTTVEIKLAPEADDSTIITLSQSHFDFQDVITGKSIRGVLQTFWALALVNLIDHLEGRALTPKVDYTTTDLRTEFVVDAAPEVVFASLIDSAQVTDWFGYPIEIEPYVGGRFAMGGLANNPDPAKILDLEPNRRLSVDWGDSGVITWELAGSEGKTRLTLVESGFDTSRIPPYGAWGGILAGTAELRRFHEIADRRPRWLSPV
jgi:uncharacterized protein YndB with AHSA1/START domain